MHQKIAKLLAATALAVLFTSPVVASAGLLDKVKEKAASQAKSGSSSTFADAKLIQPDAAIANVEGRLKTILETYYPSFKSKGAGYLEGTSGLWFVRKDMESARWYYTGKDGYHSRGVVCDRGPAEQDSRYQALKPKFEEAEAMVKEMEKAKGYEFVSCTGNDIVFKDLKTGKVLSADESSKI